jgi:hypothetical protein
MLPCLPDVRPGGSWFHSIPMQRSGQPIKKRNKPQPVPLQSNTFTMAKLSMAKQKFRPTRLGGFSGTKAYF